MKEIARLKSSDLPGDVTDIIRRDGAFIIEDLVSPETLSLFWDEVGPAFEEQSTTFTDSLLVGNTRRVFGLLGISKAISDIVVNSCLDSIASRYLGSERVVRFETEERFPTDIQLSALAAFQIMPGEKAQALHRDDVVWDLPHPTTKDAGLFSLTAATPFTADNGGTRVILGSHLWDDERVPVMEEAIPVEMPAGASLIYSSALYHGGGANVTNSQRTVININFLRGWLRQEENQFLAVPFEKARQLPRRVQELMGYKTARPYGGHIGLESPMKLFGHAD